MKLLLLSDLHVGFGQFAVHKAGYDVVILDGGRQEAPKNDRFDPKLIIEIPARKLAEGEP